PGPLAHFLVRRRNEARLWPVQDTDNLRGGGVRALVAANGDSSLERVRHPTIRPFLDRHLAEDDVVDRRGPRRAGDSRLRSPTLEIRAGPQNDAPRGSRRNERFAG